MLAFGPPMDPYHPLPLSPYVPHYGRLLALDEYGTLFLSWEDEFDCGVCVKIENLLNECSLKIIV